MANKAIHQAASATSALAAAGLVNPVLGALAGAVLVAEKLSGGVAHGPGTPSRAKHEEAFVKAHRAMPLAANQAALARYLKGNNNCKNASDPASCKRLAELLGQIILQQGGTLGPAPAAAAAPPQLPVALPVFQLPPAPPLATFPPAPVPQMFLQYPQQQYYQPEYQPQGASVIQDVLGDVTPEDVAWLQAWMRGSYDELV